MRTLVNVVLFVVFGSVVPASAQTRAEQNAYASLNRAVQAMQAKPTANRIAAVQRALRAAYNAYNRQETSRARAFYTALRHDAGRVRSEWRTKRWHLFWAYWKDLWVRYVQLLGQSAAAYRDFGLLIPRIAVSVNAGGMHIERHGKVMYCTHSASLCREIQVNGSARRAVYLRALQEHVRYKYAAIDTLHGAATAVSDLALSIIGTAERLPLENAILAVGRQAVATARAIHSTTNPMEEYDTLVFSCRNALSDLVEATETVTGRIHAYVSERTGTDQNQTNPDSDQNRKGQNNGDSR